MKEIIVCIMKSRIIIFAITFLICLNLNAQEYLSGFSHDQKQSEATNDRSSLKHITLPVFDDFSKDHVYPNSDIWQNRQVLVNSGFPLYPTNYNAATFDVLNEHGAVYSNGSSTPFIADSLLSRPIRLVDENGEPLSPADSLYFSFYYQPQGNGDAPEPHDSLVLKFGCVVDTFRIEYDTLFITDVLEYMGVDTIFVGDVLYHDYTSTCDLDMYTLAERQYTAADSNAVVAIPCDTVFYSEMRWDHVWSSEGMPLDSFLLKNNDQYFKQVKVAVTNPNYFVNDMIVLFYNYGSLPSTMYANDRSNVDNWNVDFVYFDRNRSYNDDTYNMVTFSQKSPSLLKRYNSMPYRQYVANPTVAMVADYQMYIANLDSVSVKTKYTCQIEKTTEDWSFNYESKLCDVAPFISSGFQNCDGDNATQACPHLNNFLFDLDSSVDSASYVITHIISVEDTESNVVGDTLYGKQGFYNYYSYDDGTPEMGYGVVPEDSYFASQFTLSIPDTLCGVQLLFNRTFNDANYDFFDIVVWNDNNGKPGNEIYRLENQRPRWDDNLIYKFAYYRFDKLLKVNGTIYVGIMQHSRESINIGFDTSADNHQYNFYETGGGWMNSMMKGSLMIRPVVGSNYYIGTEEIKAENNKLEIYPNPTSDVLNIANISSDKCDDIRVYDMSGRLLRQYSYECNLDVSDLSKGLYMIRVVTEDSGVYVGKFLIHR